MKSHYIPEKYYDFFISDILGYSVEYIDNLNLEDYFDALNYSLFTFNLRNPMNLMRDNSNKSKGQFQHKENIFEDPINKEQLRKKRRNK